MNMAERILEVKYKCLHQSCQIKKCKQGVLHIDESLFKQLSESFEDQQHFKSPRGYCRLGFGQTLQVVGMKEASDEEEQQEELSAEEKEIKRLTDPMEILKEEHNVVLKKLELIEQLIKRRDLDGLWITVSEIEDDIILHSIKKEEGILFPMLEKASSLTSGEISIMKEDHRELAALLQSIKDGLREGDILDGVFGSALAHLRNHVRKEDEEF
ncbi:MAG: hemerythrin domain-containing protein, partial [Nitrospira sp.]|nr:hemerythrin domain-containing protein [Nitrospira sp.]